MKKTRDECLSRLRNTVRDIEPGQKFEVDDFRPGDAPGIAHLYYAVYGEAFPVDHVYDPEELVRLNSGPDLHQVVGRTSKGDIVGLYALFRNAPGRRIMEAGSWIVLPSYRNTSLAMRMASKIHLEPPERLGLDMIFGQSVCDHVITQKMADKFQAKTCALEIEAMPPRPEDQAGRFGGRISLLDGVIVHHDRPHTVYLPERYVEPLRAIYNSCGLERRFLEDRPPDGKTVYTVQPMESADLVKMTVDETGPDFQVHLDGMEQEYPDRQIYHLVLPLWRPGSSIAVEAARKSGFFLGGLLPLWFDRDALLLQKVAGEPDIAKIQLFTRKAQDLLDLVLADRTLLNSRSS